MRAGPPIARADSLTARICTIAGLSGKDLSTATPWLAAGSAAVEKALQKGSLDGFGWPGACKQQRLTLQAIHSMTTCEI